MKPQGLAAGVSPRIGIFTERQVGIGSAALALEPYLRSLPNVAWTNVTYSEPGGLVERLPLPGRLGGVLRGFLQTGDGLRRGPYDALFFLTHNPAVLRQQAIGRTPTLLWTDVTPALLDAQAASYDHPVHSFALIQKLKATAVRRTFQRAALCVGWSEWARRSFVRDYGVPEQRTKVIPPGVDLAHWSPAKSVERSGPARILFVGGNFVRKGGDLLLDVYRRHLRGRCTLDLVTRDAIAEEDGVRVHRGITARSPALLELYRSASIFVLPTRADCFSIASIEAMSVGLPVVVSGVGGIAEIVEHDASGYVVRSDDDAGGDLRAALERLITDPQCARSMGMRGRAIVEARFDARKTADALLHLLNDIQRRRGPRKRRHPS